ncbi:MAG TPA: nitrate ABC transporter permease [Chloroflexi bacterium]|jgi:ABC-type nitrate/sulfonate/bicarbonate transport system permease component|nr:nitrate ABC transporter permease [Chloroflexota bacterium]
MTWLKRASPPIALLAAALVAWELYVDLAKVPDYLVPGPLAIFRSAIDDRDLLLQNAVPTLEIALFGFALAVVVGAGLGVLIHMSAALERTLYPIVIASQTVPVLALAPVLVLIFGFTLTPKLVIVALVCFFPITVNLVDGFKSVEPDLVRLVRSLGAGRWKLFRTVEWPAALPFLFSGAKVAVTYSVVGALFAEYVGSFEGLGHLMTEKQSQFDIAGLFAAMVVLTLIGVGLFVLVSAAERLLLPWYHGVRGDALTRR